MAHEEIHEKQHAQIAPERWWERYIAEPDFRLEQELPAHVMEYRAYCRRHTDQGARMRCLRELARRLSGPLYAQLLTENRAFTAILEGKLP
jgi:hypothetical protein